MGNLWPYKEGGGHQHNKGVLRSLNYFGTVGT